MVTPTEPAAKLEQKGYNRGLILGLTMAESMLLLVFCLLLVAAAIINAERQKAADAVVAKETTQSDLSKAQDELKQAKETNEHLQQKLAVATGSVEKAAEIEKEWRELIQARDLLQEYRQQGLEPEKVAQLKSLAKVLEQTGMSQSAKELEDRLKQLLAAETAQTNSQPHDWPPIINLSEAGGYFFRSGSAELTPAFEDKLHGSIASEIAQNLARYRVDVIEVIGHTDEQPISRAGSNLDQTIIDVVDGKRTITSIVPADNAGLGMARALAVANVLKSDPKLTGATVLPMSGAQLILPGDQLTLGQGGDVESRRRIEIRIRRRTETTSP